MVEGGGRLSMLNTRGGSMALSLLVALLVGVAVRGSTQFTAILFATIAICYAIGGVEKAVATRRAEEE